MNNFWEKVDVRGEDECWPWLGNRAGKHRDYGTFSINGRHEYAHRHAYNLANPGDPLGDRHGLHRCDNPPCCNPKHIYPGTHGDNMADRQRKGRTARGSRSGMAKLTEALVRQARERYARGGISQAQLAAAYGVAEATIQAIVEGRTWQHVRKRLKRTL